MRILLSSISTWLCYVAVLALLLAMGLVSADVILRALTNRPILGVTDVVELLFAVSLFFALPSVFLRRQHVVVDIIDTVATQTTIRRIIWISSVFGAFLLGIMLWRLAYPVSDMFRSGEGTLNIDIPRWIYGVVALVGLGVSLVMELFNLTVPNRPSEAAPDAGTAAASGPDA